MNGNDGLREMLDLSEVSRAELSRRLGLSTSWASATLSRGCDLTTTTLARCAAKLGWRLVLEGPDGERLELDGEKRAREADSL